MQLLAKQVIVAGLCSCGIPDSLASSISSTISEQSLPSDLASAQLFVLDIAAKIQTILPDSQKLLSAPENCARALANACVYASEENALQNVLEHSISKQNALQLPAHTQYVAHPTAQQMQQFLALLAITFGPQRITADAKPAPLPFGGMQFVRQTEQPFIFAAAHNTQAILGGVCVETISESTVQFRKVHIVDYVRGHGLGTHMLKSLCQYFAIDQQKQIQLDARTDRARWYERLGFTRTAEPHLSSGAWCVQMRYHP